MCFVILNKARSKMIGGCNYTKIKDQKCFLGYSISKDCEGKGLMYKALMLTNSYVFDNLDVESIRSSILPSNKRSLRLIERLGFKCLGDKSELEIAGKVRELDIYTLPA